MSGVLTQSEIDALLNQLQLGSADDDINEETEAGNPYQVYDFRTADKFSKEQIRTLRVIFENFAYLLSSQLTVSLRTSCEINVVSLEELRFSEFNNSIPTPTVLAVFNAIPFRGPFLLEIMPGIAYAIISRLLGGEADALPLFKNFTEIELAMMENVLMQIADLFRESWEKVAKIESRLERIETSPQFTQIAALNEHAAVITLDVKIDQAKDVMVFCIPHYIIQPITKKLNTTVWTLGSMVNLESDPVQSGLIAERVANTSVTLRALLNPVDVPLSELLNLRVGDVLCLDHPVHQYITVLMEQIPKFRAILGVRDHKQVLQIADIIKERDAHERNDDAR